jgi:hypothetical protein
LYTYFPQLTNDTLTDLDVGNTEMGILVRQADAQTFFGRASFDFFVTQLN